MTISASSGAVGRIAGTYIAPGMVTGALSETIPRILAGADTTAPTSQRVQLVGVGLTAGMTVASVTFVSGNTALAVGVHQYFGLYSAALAKLAESADDTSTAWGTNAPKTLAMATPYVVPSTGLYYIAILVDAGTTPSLTGWTGSTNGHQAAVSPKISGLSTSTVTALPTNAAAIAETARAPYAYVS